MKRRLYCPILISAVLSLGGCGGSMPSSVGYSSAESPARRIITPDLKQPILITLDAQGGELEYWTIRPRGGSKPKPLSASLGIYDGYGLVANGNTIAIANYDPPEVVTYDIKTKATQTLSDPYGYPVDIAIDKKATLYVLNFVPGSANVAVYPAGTSNPTELTCTYVTGPVAIAVDNESDVFVNGYGPGGFMGVIEYPNASQPCTKLHLRAEQGYAGGVGVDPKTDDLIVVDNPGQCAGGFEGRMIIYPKPYEGRTSRRRNLNALYCAGTVRLSSTSALIFVADETISAGFPIVDQHTYPGAKGHGIYRAGFYGPGTFGGFTTIPNTLPN